MSADREPVPATCGPCPAFLTDPESLACGRCFGCRQPPAQMRVSEAPKALRRITFVLEADCEPPGEPMWCVSSPELGGLLTQGRTLAEALEMAADAARGLELDLLPD